MERENVWVLFGVVLFVVGCAPVVDVGNNGVNSTFQIAKVSRVIDGDTFVLESGERVRLICINTPERGKPGFNEAKRFLENMTLGVSVALERDVSDKDRYGRLLRYVYIDRGQMVSVNAELVRFGFAEVVMYPPDLRHCGEYYEIQNKTGL